VFGLDAGKPYLRLQEGKTSAEARAEQPVAGATWPHLAFTLADRALLYVDGRPAGKGCFRMPEMRSDVAIGAAAGLPGLAAEIDELQISNLARAPEWFRAAALSQHPQSAPAQYGGDESGGGMDYPAIVRHLAGAVSRVGWIIIGIIGVIGLVTAEVALVKLRLVGRVGRQNGDFLADFRDLASALARLAPDAAAAHADEWKDAPLFKLYEAATDGLAAMRRLGIVGALTPEALEVIRANVDTSLVNESQRLNKRLALLTLAVSAAPFLGLLGTVVGIMITFGAIAMAGDVNVNTIAPGVAAAITTTVAGLIVAIPAMFTYNVLATRIKEITTGMEIFANELISRIALEASRPAQAGSAPAAPRLRRTRHPAAARRPHQGCPAARAGLRGAGEGLGQPAGQHRARGLRTQQRPSGHRQRAARRTGPRRAAAGAAARPAFPHPAANRFAGDRKWQSLS
jgi:biopolymer transport protein ExbB